MDRLFPYGLDAPPVVRNLLLGSFFCGALFMLDLVGILPIHVNGLIWPTLSMGAGAIAMIWSSARGKIREREIILDRIDWRGDERVIDIGCGRGLFTVAAARRVPRGHVVGIDIWQVEDLSGNGPGAVIANAAREGVSGRVECRSADMREIPFPDNSFDVALSSAAIHNLYEAADRARAIREIARVLAPDGRLVISDIRHLSDYARWAREAGVATVVSRSIGDQIWRFGSFGFLAPGLVLGRKGPE
ncbi:class I SAM-dependent methyltransferase [Nitrospirillum pindoramense]|uniref:Methyltransferase family protein n=1 Tax=Nitrospirillum amazonense TaxID=28077 RepID=A0A560H420_9PROT|nr:class I SAM-dependent methyltransferase [Nitrospirillum amazonense]TWB41033.1 methyltransferase family protein [Nitrospirillum amazonense]